jgi:hypothetical protein
MSHCITVTISADHEPKAEFMCYEPEDAWCQQNVVGPGEERPEDPTWCWFTVLASGLVPSGIYEGPPTELRSGEVEFVCVSAGSGEDMCSWHYRGDVGQLRTCP